MRDVVRLITQIQNVPGTNKKLQIIAENRNNVKFTKFLCYALDPMRSYNASERILSNIRGECIVSPEMTDIFAVCDILSARKGIDTKTIKAVRTFLDSIESREETELYIKLLSKTLRLGVTAKSVNKVIPGLVPEWEVQQAYPIDHFPIPEGTWFALTEKLNGVRATYCDGKLVGRSGNYFTGLDHIVKELEKLKVFTPSDMCYDGELVLKDKRNMSDNEAFRAVAGIVNSDNENKMEVCFVIFDLFHDEFDHPYKIRRRALEVLGRACELEHVRIHPVLYQGTDQGMINELMDKMVQEDKEGLMANLDVPYERRRHRGILKIKRFYTMDLPIVACEEGSGRLKGTLGAFVLDFKGNQVKVGSGFSDRQRAEFWANRDSLVGTLCEVKYKEISMDKNTGAESLQFPVFISIRQDKEDISFG